MERKLGDHLATEIWRKFEGIEGNSEQTWLCVEALAFYTVGAAFKLSLWSEGRSLVALEAWAHRFLGIGYGHH